MASRPAFFLSQGQVSCKTYSFQWYPGFAASQKRRCVESLHEAIRAEDPGARPLEVSTRSGVPLGEKLSAFRLRLGGVPLENVFQSAKVFEHGGPFPDLLALSPGEAKRDGRLRSSGALTAFRYKGEDVPLTPPTAFYDWLYCLAVRESVPLEELRELARYDRFTDIEFNPARSLNTQARTVSLIKLLLEEGGCLPDFSREDFFALHRTHVPEMAPL